MIDQKTKKKYSIYIIRCADDTLYTGVTNDVRRRFKEHQEGKGAKYTRAHRAEAIVYQKRIGTRGEAQQCEAAIKRLPRAEKLVLIERYQKKKVTRKKAA